MNPFSWNVLDGLLRGSLSSSDAPRYIKSLLCWQIVLAAMDVCDSPGAVRPVGHRKPITERVGCPGRHISGLALDSPRVIFTDLTVREIEQRTRAGMPFCRKTLQIINA